MSFFSKNLLYLRKAKSLSRSELATKINVNQSTISRWENEEMGVTVDSAYDVAAFFNISIADLLGRDLRKKDEQKKVELSKEQEQQLLNDVLKRKGFLDENEELSEENYNRLIEFAKANKQFIMKDNDKK